MPAFDQSKAYAAQEETDFFDDGREVALLHHIYSLPTLSSLRNNPTAILAAIDDYARTQKYLMNVGEDKGVIVTQLIRDVRPRTMLELGGYVGYSALLFGAAVREAWKSADGVAQGTRPKYYSLERNPEFAAVILSLVHLAGLQDVVEVVVGPSEESLQRLHAEGKVSRLDLMFLDHYKPAYTTDLKLCEELGLIGPGTVLAADNVVKPGNPPYLKYVRATVHEKRKWLDEHLGGEDGVQEAFPDRTKNQYSKTIAEEKIRRLRGNPHLIYHSELVESWEPTGEPDGVEITQCHGEER